RSIKTKGHYARVCKKVPGETKGIYSVEQNPTPAVFLGSVEEFSRRSDTKEHGLRVLGKFDAVMRWKDKFTRQELYVVQQLRSALLGLPAIRTWDSSKGEGFSVRWRSLELESVGANGNFSLNSLQQTIGFALRDTVI
ncbi:hypothetical protein HPB47_019352, partial [Ixodes persulcatus]